MYSHPHEAIHEQLRLLRWWEQYQHDERRSLTSHREGKEVAIDPHYADNAAALHLLVLGSASPVWVDPDISDGLRSAMDSLPSINPLRPEDMPIPAGFALLGGIPWTSDSPEDHRIGARVIAWKAFDWGVYVMGFGVFHPDDLVATDPLNFGWTVPWNFGDPVDQVPLDGVTLDGRAASDEKNEMIYERTTAYALWSFMQQRITGFDNIGFDRPTRRSLPTSYGGEHFIREVVLRSYAKRPSQSSGDAGWHLSSRHIVRGHWTNQYYPSLGAVDEPGSHKPLWIEAYVKGPEGTPLRDGTQLIKVIR